MLSCVIVAKMKLDFELGVIALVQCVTVAVFLYFCYVTNLNRGLGGDHLEEQVAENQRQERNRRLRGTDWLRSENFTANSPLRQRPEPQENDEPLY